MNKFILLDDVLVSPDNIAYIEPFSSDYTKSVVVLKTKDSVGLVHFIVNIPIKDMLDILNKN